LGAITRSGRKRDRKLFGVSPPLDFAVDEAADGSGDVRLRVSGDVDIRTAPILEDAIRTRLSAGRPVVLDLQGVNFMDSSGLSVLIGSIQEARRNDWTFSVDRRLSPDVSRLVQISGLTRLLESVAADEQAR
jgi:anti-anti-sigma factor